MINATINPSKAQAKERAKARLERVNLAIEQYKARHDARYDAKIAEFEDEAKKLAELVD